MITREDSDLMINPSSIIQRIRESRGGLISREPEYKNEKAVQEGGCGVVGFASDCPVRGRHIFEPSIQMHNRGNGKGGGIAAACFIPDQLGVNPRILKNDYILQIALLDNQAESDVENTSILPYLLIDHKIRLKPAVDYQEIGLAVKPPDIVRYFVRVKEKELARFAQDNRMNEIPSRRVEDEFIYQSSFRLNQKFYSSLGEKRAFVLSHARNLMIFKIVGYAEQVVKYYGLEDLQAQIWIAHQRYPTKGRVWHPAGSHPFIGMNEALVHNGDFANYFSVSQYLLQHNIQPQFLTDTEVSVLLFDLLIRVYNYPLEYVIEAMAPTTELDFDQLPEAKRKIYRAIQALHIHGSPDGPWFFIIARSDSDNDQYQLLGITDTSMLRPQVFALQEGEVSIGLIASEKQAIDATLHSLALEDQRFRLMADKYWNARGGSHTDGGAFSFTLKGENGQYKLSCSDKFQRPIRTSPGDWRIDLTTEPRPPENAGQVCELIQSLPDEGRCKEAFDHISKQIAAWDFDHLRWLDKEIKRISQRSDEDLQGCIRLLSLLFDRRYDCGGKKRSMLLQSINNIIKELLDSIPSIASDAPGRFKRIDWGTRRMLRSPGAEEACLVVFARDFPPEGEECDAKVGVSAYHLGWKNFIFYGLKGQRFTGCGFGPDTDGVKIDVYDSCGDYLASGIDGMEICVHCSGQDQLGQIMKRGRLVVYGDVGQAFMYGAKGGEVYIMGNAAGRPLINAVGRPKVVINGTCLDFLAESFMAGDPFNGGGFVILNGLEFDDKGQIRPLQSPYPGANLFSLASGGALYVRDPKRTIVTEQLNGGEFTELTPKDWDLMLPHLKVNEEYFGISIRNDLLSVDGIPRAPHELYRKVRAVKLAVLSSESIPE